MKIEKTARGFDYKNFKDSKGVDCSIQLSSIATEEAIWFGCDDADPQVFYPYTENPWRKLEKPQGAQDWVFNTRMHLTREQVADLLPTLQHFVNTGEIDLNN